MAEKFIKNHNNALKQFDFQQLERSLENGG